MSFLNDKLKNQKYLYLISIDDVRKVKIVALMNEYKQILAGNEVKFEEISNNLNEKSEVYNEVSNHDSSNPLEKVINFYIRENALSMHIKQILPFIGGISLKQPSYIKHNAHACEFKKKDSKYPVVVVLSNAEDINADAISDFKESQIHSIYQKGELLSPENVLDKALDIQKVFKNNKIFSSDFALSQKLEEYIYHSKMYGHKE